MTTNKNTKKIALSYIMQRSLCVKITSLSLLSMFIANPAYAHHPSNYATPASPVSGILSGLAHPIISFSQLLLIISLGAIIAIARGSFNDKAPYKAFPLYQSDVFVFVLASFIGILLHNKFPVFYNAIWPDVALVIAMLCLGVFITFFIRHLNKSYVMPTLLSFFGFTHGAIMSESVIGMENTPLTFYLMGVSATQYLTLFLVIFCIRYFKIKTTNVKYATISLIFLSAITLL